MTAILGRTGNLVGFSTGRGTTPWDTEMEAALRKMDAMLASTVVAITNTLPGSANEGDLYLVGTSPTGVAAGWANRIARWRSSPAGWEAYQPMQGWIITIVGESTDKVRRYNGTAWVALAADAGAEPYAGTPAQTSFWRSTAAGGRAWVQLVAADITDLATTLAAYLTKANPTYTGNVYGAGSVIWRAPAADHYFSLYGIETEFGLRDLNNNGSILNYPFVVKRGAAGEVQIGYSGGIRPVRIGGAIKNDNLAGAGTRPMVALADGTIDDQDAATFRGTIGAAEASHTHPYLPINNPTFTGTMQGPYLRISSLASGLNGVPVSNFVGELSVKTADQFRAYASCAYSGDIGQPNGIASLDATGRVPSGQLPSYVDDVIEATNFAALPGAGESGKIYVTLDGNKTWRWSGSGYAEISASLALGETSSTAYRGDRGAIAYAHSQVFSGNPHGTTAADVGAAKKPSKIDVSASANLGSIDASAIKVTATDVTLTCSGGFDGQGWDIINPTTSTGIAIPTGVTLWKSIGSNVGPTTIALGGGRPIRITRIDASTWTMLGSQ